MPGDSLSLLEKIASLVGILGASWLAIFKYMGLSKDNAAFKKEVNTIVSAQNAKIEKVSVDIVDIKTGIDFRLVEHRLLADKLLNGLDNNTERLAKLDDYITSRRSQKLHDLDAENKDLKAEIDRLRNK